MSKIYKYELAYNICNTLRFMDSKPTFLRAAEQDGKCICWIRLDDAVNTAAVMKLRLVMTGEEFDSKLKWLDTFQNGFLVVHVMEALE